MEYIKIKLHGKYGKGKFTLVDGDYDGEYFSQYKWYLSPAGYVFRKSYSGEGRKNTYIYLHHEVCFTPKGMWADHINRNKLDNRGCNLRWATPAQSCQNRIGKKNKNGFIGVSLFKSKYTGKITFKAIYNRRYLGTFKTREEAAMSRDNEVRKLCGDFGVYNF